MVRAILAVVVGYVTMFLLVMLTFSVAYLAMGADGAFQPDSYEVSALWLVTSFVLGFLVAVAGGVICVAIARATKPAMVLAGVVLVLGLVMAVPVLMAPNGGQPAVRESEVGNFEAMQRAKQPAWVALLNPFVGAVGVLLGARVKGAKDA